VGRRAVGSGGGGGSALGDEFVGATQQRGGARQHQATARRCKLLQRTNCRELDHFIAVATNGLRIEVCQTRIQLCASKVTYYYGVATIRLLKITGLFCRM